jgi:5,10-methylenetetrahydromethanopterin reductase
VVKRAEELGFREAWLYDSQLLCADVFVHMALAAAATSKIRLGTGVLIPTNRIAPVTANAFASINAIAPGRLDFGVGTGFTGRNTMGLPAQKLDDMARYVDEVRALWRDEVVDFAVEGTTRKIRFLNADAGMIDIEHPIGVHISAFGPRGRRLTAETGDGWITFTASPEAAAAQAAEIDAACRAAGRDPKSLARSVFTLGCVLGDGETTDSPRARAQAGPMASVGLHGAMERWESLPPPVRDSMATYRGLYETFEPKDARYIQMHRGHLVYVRPEEEPFVTGESIARSTFTASAAELRDRLRAYEAAGYTQFTVQLVHGHEDAIEDWARLFDLV